MKALSHILGRITEMIEAAFVHARLLHVISAILQDLLHIEKVTVIIQGMSRDFSPGSSS